MSCRFSELVVDCADPVELSRFWCAVLDYVELSRETADDGIEIGPPSGFGGAAPTLVFSRTAEPKAGKLRMHIDVNPVDRDQDAELARLLSLGARPAEIGQTGEEAWHTLQDPEGNEFCLLHSRLPELAGD
ncbi:MAG: VOC family protein [Actinophytocola sp.]|uniref:VOC family protein n=1 Tax=Actinophytocola sp. TaxID=1872138 RepID=UPI003C789A28